MLQVTPVPILADNYAWVIQRPPGPEVALVDPGESEPLQAYLRRHQLDLRWVLLTHHHADHTGGTAELARDHTLDVLGPRRDGIRGLTTVVDEGDVIPLDGLDVELDVWHTPGHTSGHVCYLASGVAFTGDTLFAGGCGRVFEGTPAQMHASLERLAALPDHTAVCCAHEYTAANLRFALAVEPENVHLQDRLQAAEETRRAGAPTVPSSIALERLTNPFLRCHVPAVRKAAERQTGHPLGTPEEVFAAVRRWKDGF